MSKSLEARIAKLEHATNGKRVLLAIWGDPGPAELERRIAERAADAGIPAANVVVVQAKWLEGRNLSGLAR